MRYQSILCKYQDIFSESFQNIAQTKFKTKTAKNILLQKDSSSIIHKLLISYKVQISVTNYSLDTLITYFPDGSDFTFLKEFLGKVDGRNNDIIIKPK